MTTHLRWGALVAIASLAVLIPAGFASAQDTDPYIGPSPSVAAETSIAPSATAAPAETAQNAGTEVASANLAFTGGDATTLAIVGLLAVGLGGGLVLMLRRSTASNSV